MGKNRIGDALHGRLQKAIDSQVFPGCVCSFFRADQEHAVALGFHSYDSGALPMHEYSVFDVASVTKAIPTSCLALQLIESKLLCRSDLLIAYMPEFAGSYRDQIRIEHLLTQTLDFDFRLSACRDLGASGILNAIMTARLRSAPGTVFAYANATSILLGIVVERICGKRLDRAAHERFFDPLGMKYTAFHVLPHERELVVPTEIDPWRGRLVQGEVHDESAWGLRPEIIAGSAGLFSTAPDLLLFLRMLVCGGCAGPVRYFSEETVVSMNTNQLQFSSGESTGLGWELNQSYMGASRTATTFGKTGFTGCMVVADRQRQAGCVLLTNHIYPRRRSDRASINGVRSDVADIVLGALPA